MKIGTLTIACTFIAAAGVLVLDTPGTAQQQERPSLAAVIPADVFLYIEQTPNPERKFLDDYWAEVLDAVLASGLATDVLDLLGSLMGQQESEALSHVQERASELLAAVDWKRFGKSRSAFAERFEPPQLHDGKAPMLTPDMVWMVRGGEESVAQSYQELTTLLEGIAQEIPGLEAGTKFLVVEKSTRSGAEVARVDLLRAIPGAPSMPLSVVRKKDVLLIAFREKLLDEILGLMDGKSARPTLAASDRFKAAFARLPAAEESLEFFDVQSMLGRVREFLDLVFGLVTAPSDTYMNTGMNPAASALNQAAIKAYRQHDVEQALSLTRKAHEEEPRDCIVLYNLACFSALLGHKEEALSWLEKAVEAGFYAPGKIAGDADLKSLQDEPQYLQALAHAKSLAAQRHAEDVVLNSSKTGEAYALTMQAWQSAAEQDYEQALRLAEQAFAVAPEDSRVLYALTCFHAQLGHQQKALDLLGVAVECGFYCPAHIAKDPDLASIRGTRQYEDAVKLASKKATEQTTGKEAAWADLARGLIDRVLDAAAVFDHVATVQGTDGYSVWRDSVTALVPGAEKNPIYPVLGHGRQRARFDRFLPQETLSFSTSAGVDPNALYRYVEQTVRGSGPVGEKILAKWTEIQKQLGVDFQKDVFGWIDGASTSVTLADGRGSAWLLQVNDEEVARARLATADDFLTNKLPTLIAEAAAENPALARLAMLGVRTTSLEHEHLEGFRNLYFSMMPQPMVYGVADGHLVFGSTADAAALCLRTARGEHPNIKENSQAMEETILPSGPFVGLSLTDRRNLTRELSAGMGVASMVTGMMGAAVPDPKVQRLLAGIGRLLGKLPPVLHKIDFYKSVSTQTTFDGKAWRVRCVTHYRSPEERAAPGPR